MDFYHNRWHLIGMDSNEFEANELRTLMLELSRGFETGALKVATDEAVPFARAVASYEKNCCSAGNA